ALSRSAPRGDRLRELGCPSTGGFIQSLRAFDMAVARHERACRLAEGEMVGESNGAEGGIRTPTGLLQLAPEASASAVPPLPQVDVFFEVVPPRLAVPTTFQVYGKPSTATTDDRAKRSSEPNVTFEDGEHQRNVKRRDER